jgi:hypothetical protein
MSFELINGHEVTPRNSVTNLGAAFVQFITRLFGCWHTEMSKPFSEKDGPVYRDCLTCGARRHLDSDWRMVGPYYFPNGAQR